MPTIFNAFLTLMNLGLLALNLVIHDGTPLNLTGISVSALGAGFCGACFLFTLRDR